MGTDDRSPFANQKLGWVQEQILLTLLDRYRAIEASGDPKAGATLEAHGVRCSPRDLVHAPDRANLPAVIGHAAKNLERRGFIARSPVQRIGSTATLRDVRLLPDGRTHAEALAVLRETAPEELAGPVRKPSRPDPTTETGPLWQGLDSGLAEQARHLLATWSPTEALALGMLLVRESLALGADAATHRAAFSVEDVATLVKVSPALVQLEIQRGALLASKIGHVYRITPMDLQAWLEKKRPDKRLREYKRSR
jgi:hypothetical protein